MWNFNGTGALSLWTSDLDLSFIHLLQFQSLEIVTIYIDGTFDGYFTYA